MYAEFKTSQGDFTAKLFETETPKTVQNFVDLARGTRAWKDPKTHEMVKRPLYPNTFIHRVVPQFMIQMGDPTGTGRGGPGYQFADEFHPELQFDKPYLLAMANAGPGTNGSQFFITVGQTPHLNRKHTIFGEVVDPESQKVVDAIATTATDRSDRPTDPVVIESITVS